jgi:hypothetical protein
MLTTGRRGQHRGGCCGCLPEPAPKQPHEVPRIAQAFLGVVGLECALLLSLSVLLFIYHDPVVPVGQVYAGLGIACTLAQGLFAGEAVLTENKPQLFGFLVVATLLSSFVTFQAWHNPLTLGPLWAAARYYIVGVKLSFEVVYLGLTLPVWRSFGFWAYKVREGERE